MQTQDCGSAGDLLGRLVPDSWCLNTCPEGLGLRFRFLKLILVATDFTFHSPRACCLLSPLAGLYGDGGYEEDSCGIDIGRSAAIPVVLCFSLGLGVGWMDFGVNTVPNDDTTIKRKFDVNLIHFAACFSRYAGGSRVDGDQKIESLSRLRVL